MALEEPEVEKLFQDQIHKDRIYKMYFDCMPASMKAMQREERNMFPRQLPQEHWNRSHRYSL